MVRYKNFLYIIGDIDHIAFRIVFHYMLLFANESLIKYTLDV